MQWIDVLEILVVLFSTVIVGVVAHELSHVVALRLSGITCSVAVLPKPGDHDGLTSGVAGPLVRVTPTRVPDDLSPWRLRAAALMPLWLALPLVAVLVGVVPDPFAAGGPAPKLVLLVWVGCSIPSPQDFSLAWYPERAAALAREASLTAPDGARWSIGN